MRIGIMQPYFLPYIGYWQLMYYVDDFVIYDEIEYEKQGWINRNRYLCNGEAKYFILPLKKDSDYLYVNQRYISDCFNRDKLLNQFKMAYGRAPEFQEIYPLLKEIINYKEDNLFRFILNSLNLIKDYLGIKTRLVISSQISYDNSLRGKEKVKEICRKLSADEYINPIGGTELYDRIDFSQAGIRLGFIKTDGSIRYPQMRNEFVESLSILDVLMFNSKKEVQNMLNQFTII